MVHLVLLFSSGFASIKKNKNLWLGFTFAILILFAVLRYDFGNDYLSYYRIYNEIKAGNFQRINATESLFIWLVMLCPNYYVLIAVTSVITIIPVFLLIKNNVADNYKGLAVLIYCINPYLFLMSLSAIRQMLALSFFIMAIHFSKKHKILPYIIFVVLASMCHMSAIVLLPFYFIANDRKVNKIEVFAVILILLVILLDSEIFDRLIQYGLNIFDNTNYDHYATQGVGNTLRATLLSSVWFVYIIININKLSGTTLMFAKLSLFAYIFEILAFRVSMFTRLTMYFEIFSIITIPMIIYQNNNTLKKSNTIFDTVNKYVFPILIFTIYILRYYSFFVNPLWEAFREYHTIFSARW